MPGRLAATLMIALAAAGMIFYLSASVRVGCAVGGVMAALVWLAAGMEDAQRLPGERKAAGLCPHCGYDLAGNVSGVCPECGKARD